MRRPLVLSLIVVLAGVAAFLLVTRDRVDGWLACTMPQRNDTPATATAGPSVESVGFEVVAAVDGALAMDFHPATGAMYVGTKGGTVERIADGVSETVVDISGEVSTTLEQGLLGVAIAPSGDYLYVDFTDVDDDTHVIEFELDGDGSPRAASRREVLMVEQPFHTHNGGHLLFGPDGYLWIGLGDGGGSLKGPDFGFGANAQDLSSLHGSLLRIDPRPSGDAAYSIPPDNPFVGVEGARGEIWVMGLRNPWRFSFDSETGDLWVGDVGQFCWEEINYLPASEGSGAAENLGWPMVEGPDDYRGGDIDGVAWAAYDVPHSDGDRSIVGGVVYRGSAIAQLYGWYLFTDTYVGRMRALRIGADGGVEVRQLGADRGQAVSFAEGPDGEIYVMSFQEGVSKLIPAAPAG